MRIYLSINEKIAASKFGGYTIGVTPSGKVYRYTEFSRCSPTMMKLRVRLFPFPVVRREEIAGKERHLRSNGRDYYNQATEQRVAGFNSQRFVAAVDEPLVMIGTVVAEQEKPPVLDVREFIDLDGASQAKVVEAINTLEPRERPSKIPGFVLKNGAFVPA